MRPLGRGYRVAAGLRAQAARSQPKARMWRSTRSKPAFVTMSRSSFVLLTTKELRSSGDEPRMSLRWMGALCVIGACSNGALPLPTDSRACTFPTDRPGAGVQWRIRSPRGSLGGVVPDVRYFIIDIAPGESVCAGLPPENSSKIVFQMTTEGSGTTLRVHNPYADVVTFKALACLDEAEGVGCHESSTCPVGPGLTHLLHWPEDLHRVEVSSITRHAPGEVSTECAASAGDD